MRVSRAVVFSALLAGLGACAQGAQNDVIAAPPVAHSFSEPSPRAACAPARVTIYFAEELASDEPVVTPLLNDFMERIRACEAAGGELRTIVVATTADPGQSARNSRAQIARRIERVRDALVQLGAPADKIVGATAETEAVMGRRAEIVADLY